MRRGFVLLLLSGCFTNPPSRGAPPASPSPPTAYRPATYTPALPRARSPGAPRAVAVRVLGVRWRGQWPSDESGPWSLGDAPLIVRNLNASAGDTGLSFRLESAAPIDVVDGRYAEVPATRADAIAAMDSFATSGRVSNETLTVVVVWPSQSWVSGWGQQGHPLRTPGKWPIIIVNTRIAKSREAHWIGHELGHVFGFYDTTFYDASPVDNPPYTQCGLFIASRTYPQSMAPPGARQNLMSYDTGERQSYFSAGYDVTHRQILDCWMRSSGL